MNSDPYYSDPYYSDPYYSDPDPYYSDPLTAYEQQYLPSTISTQTSRIPFIVKIIIFVVIIIATFFMTRYLMNKFFTEGMANVGANDKVLVLFYRPGCPWCKKMMPAWYRLKKKYPKKLQKVNCDDNAMVMTRYNISSVPSILLMKGKRVLKKYMGDRSTKDMEKFLMSN